MEAENEGKESDGEQEDGALSLQEGMELCEHLEKLCVIHSEAWQHCFCKNNCTS